MALINTTIMVQAVEVVHITPTYQRAPLVNTDKVMDQMRLVVMGVMLPVSAEAEAVAREMVEQAAQVDPVLY